MKKTGKDGMVEPINFTHPEYEFDDIAEHIFYPIYDVIAGDLLEETGITSGRLLDVGCGGGHLGLAVMARAEFTGDFLDINRTAVGLAGERAAKRGLADRCSFHVADVEDMPFEDGVFDLIISRGSMFFWEHQQRAFKEICRVLAPGGRTFIGGSLGRPWQRKAIMEKMEQNNLVCMGQQKDCSKALPDQEYGKLAAENGCSFHVVKDDRRGHWLVLTRPPFYTSREV